MLVDLIASLSMTSKKHLVYNRLREILASLSVLSVATSDKQQKKRNEINACKLIGLVTPTGDAGADKRAPRGPIRVRKNKREKHSGDRGHDHFQNSASTFCRGDAVFRTAAAACQFVRKHNLFRAISPTSKFHV